MESSRGPSASDPCGAMRVPFRPILARLPLAAAALAFAGAAHASILYKSIGPNGVVQFSDTPPEKGIIVEERKIGDPPSMAPNAVTPVGALALLSIGSVGDGATDEADLARANSQLDLAEHALALARRSTWSPRDGLRLKGVDRNSADDERIDFYKRNLAAARRNLMEVLKRYSR